MSLTTTAIDTPLINTVASSVVPAQPHKELSMRDTVRDNIKVHKPTGTVCPSRAVRESVISLLS